MRVSQFEVYRLCQRSLEALGAPYGVDRDGAAAVVWLEARGLPGLALLAGDLPALARPGAFAGLALAPGAHDGEARLDAGGRSALAFLGGAVDLLRLLAARAPDRCGRLRLEGCRSPLFLLPGAVAACGPDDGVEIAWGGLAARIGRRRLSIAVLPGLDPAEALGESGPVAVGLALAPGSGRGARPSAAPILTQDDLDESFVRALDQGIEADDALWQQLSAIAARVQVPASEVSRLKGAGGGDANA